MDETTHCVVLTTCGSKEEAAALAGGLVQARLAACVQALDITSFYTWEGRVNHDPEVLLLAKTRTDRYPEVEAFVRERHSYDLPEIIRLPVTGGLTGYLGWVDESVEPAPG